MTVLNITYTGNPKGQLFKIVRPDVWGWSDMKKMFVLMPDNMWLCCTGFIHFSNHHAGVYKFLFDEQIAEIQGMIKPKISSKNSIDIISENMLMGFKQYLFSDIIKE